MRKVCYCLDKTFELSVLYFVEHQCENDWCGEVEDNVVKTDKNGVLYNRPEKWACKELDVVLKAYKLTSHNAESRSEILECNYQTKHWQIAEKEEIDDDRNSHKVENEIVSYFITDTLAQTELLFVGVDDLFFHCNASIK